MSEIEWTTQKFTAQDDVSLAQRLFDTGLLFLINSAVLHHHGLALGVVVADDRSTVTGLSIHETSDPEGIWFAEDEVVAGRRKLREAGLR